MTPLVAYLLLFVAVGIGFIFVHLMAGKLIRPSKPDPDKLTIYECGEPTIGSAWVQFDLRFYVVALLFVIFDVEMAFFFPWAVVFGQANQLADPALPAEARAALVANWQQPPTTGEAVLQQSQKNPGWAQQTTAAASELAWVAFVDILFFFGVLLVGFAYLWKRGDLDWVRSTAAQKAAARMEGLNGESRPREELVVLTKD